MWLLRNSRSWSCGALSFDLSVSTITQASVHAARIVHIISSGQAPINVLRLSTIYPKIKQLTNFWQTFASKTGSVFWWKAFTGLRQLFLFLYKFGLHSPVWARQTDSEKAESAFYSTTDSDMALVNGSRPDAIHIHWKWHINLFFFITPCANFPVLWR